MNKTLHLIFMFSVAFASVCAIVAVVTANIPLILKMVFVPACLAVLSWLLHKALQ